MSWALGVRRVPVSCDLRLPSALPRRQEGLERRVSLCRALLVREVSSPGNRRRGEVLGPELGHVDHLRCLEFPSPRVFICGSRPQIEIINQLDVVLIEK